MASVQRVAGGPLSRARQSRSPIAALPSGEVSVVSSVAAPVDARELVALKPYGIVLGVDDRNPLLILKDESGEESLPIFLSPAAAANTLFEASPQAHEGAPHKLTQMVLQHLGCVVQKCIFSEILGHHQYVEMHVQWPDGRVASLRCRADEAISFCLFSRVDLYASREHMAKARDLEIHRASVDARLVDELRALVGEPFYLN